MSRKKSVVITGASKGIGAACVRKFLDHDFHVIAISRKKSNLNKMQRKLGCYSGDLSCLAFDLSKISSIAKLGMEISQLASKVDGFVFNAGTSNDLNFPETTVKSRRMEMMLNYESPLAIVGHYLSPRPQQSSYKFIGVGSLSSETGFPGNVSYAASKAALSSAWKSLDQEFAGTENKFGFVLPGLTDTDMAKEYHSILPKRSAESVATCIYENYLNPKLGQTIGVENQAALVLSRIAPRPVSRLVKSFNSILIAR